MIRAATYQDAPAIMAMIRTQHSRSKYAGRCGISESALAHVVTQMIAQQNQYGPQGSLVLVAENSGEPVAFIAGILDRIYQIGDKLSAQDLFFVNERGSVSDTIKLLDGYIAWAKSIRACIEVTISWTDTLPGAERIAKLFGRKGFSKTGEMFEIRKEPAALARAA
jgi:hypothetical protein